MGSILVTGANGLVGYALRKTNNPDFVFVTRADADLTNYSQTKELFENIRPEKVIHLAAVVGGIGGNMIHSGEYFRNNTMINMNVLECSRLAGVKKLVSFMSTCVFPDRCTYPLNEKDLHMVLLIHQISVMRMQNECWRYKAAHIEENGIVILSSSFPQIFTGQMITGA